MTWTRSVPSDITVVIPTSPIPSHPDTAVLEETLASARHHVHDAEIIVTFDGVRAEQGDQAVDYAEYIRRALWLLDKQFQPVVPWVCSTHQHQTGMMHTALKLTRTPLLLYMEHDTPLVTDEPIHWDLISRFILSGESHLVRFHHEARIPEEHQHMMHGLENVLYERTRQWSQRPHLASTDFYRHIMGKCFTPHANSFIEDRMHGVVDEAFHVAGMHGLNKYRLHIYTPDGNIKRSYHTDGRAGGSKWDESQVF